MEHKINNLTEETIKRLEKYPTLKECVEDFIENEGENPDSSRLTKLVVYIRELCIYEPDVFKWDDEVAEDFYTWGHNSRYAFVLEPMLCNNLNWHIECLLDVLEEHANFQEPEMKEEK